MPTAEVWLSLGTPRIKRARLCMPMARQLAVTWLFNTVALFVATWLLSA